MPNYFILLALCFINSCTLYYQISAANKKVDFCKEDYFFDIDFTYKLIFSDNANNAVATVMPSTSPKILVSCSVFQNLSLRLAI